MIEQVQFYRDGAWTNWYSCIRPMSIEDKYDETLDRIQLQFVSTDAPFDRFTRARVVFSNDALTYSNGVPTNHYEMVVDSSDVQSNSYYTLHTYTLLEVTSVLKYIRMESLTFTSKDSISIYEGGFLNTYTKSVYNLLSVLQRIFKVTRFKTNLEDMSLTGKIQLMDSALLQTNLLNVDDEFVENTVYDALVKIGKYINRVPVLYFSKTGSYEYDLWFERKDGLNGISVAYSTFISNNQGIMKSQSSGLGADTVVSDATNMVSYNVAQGVAQDWYGFPSFNEELLVTSSTNKKPFLLAPHRIVGVVKLRKLRAFYVSSGTPFYSAYFESVRCIPYSQWLVDEDRNDIAYFKDGENKIYFGDNLGEEIYTVNKSAVVSAGLYEERIFFNLNYYPLIDTKVIATKNGTITYETTFNQTDAFVDAGSYGMMLKDYIKTHGNADITLTRKFTTYASIYAIGTRVIDNNDTYIVTSRSIKTKQDEWQVVFQLNKDATKRSQWVKASEKIREHGINYDKTQVRYSTIHEKINLDFITALGGLNDHVTTTMKYLAVKNMLFANLFTSTQKITYRDDFIQTAYIRSSSTLNKVGTGTITQYQYCQLGFGATRVGQSVLLNVRFQDNKIAGYRVDTSNGGEIEQTPVYYSNPFAEIDKISIAFGKYATIDSTIVTAIDTVAPDYFTMPTGTFSVMASYANTYPSISQSAYEYYVDLAMIRIPDYEYYKDGREIGNISYQLEFIGKNKTLFNSELLDYCGLLTKDKVQPTLYVIVCNSGIEIGENDIITASQIYSVTTANNPILTNMSIAIRYNTSNLFVANNQTIALCTSLGGGNYRPLIFKNNQTVENMTVYIAY